MARKAGAPLSARCRLGQHANPSASNAMPKHRPSSVPAPETSAPSSTVTTIVGSISRTRPVPTSTTAAKARIFRRVLRLVSLTGTLRTVAPPRPSLLAPRGITGSGARGSWDHAAFKHLVQHGCSDLVDEGHACLRIVAQELYGQLLLLRWRLVLLRPQLLAGGSLVLLDHFVSRIVQQHPLGPHGASDHQG